MYVYLSVCVNVYTIANYDQKTKTQIIGWMNDWWQRKSSGGNGCRQAGRQLSSSIWCMNQRRASPTAASSYLPRKKTNTHTHTHGERVWGAPERKEIYSLDEPASKRKQIAASVGVLYSIIIINLIIINPCLSSKGRRVGNGISLPNA